jgi:hypothetical protein
MSDERIKSQGNSYRKKMNAIYSPALNRFYDLVSRNDFCGLVGEMTIRISGDTILVFD